MNDNVPRSFSLFLYFIQDKFGDNAVKARVYSSCGYNMCVLCRWVARGPRAKKKSGRGRARAIETNKPKPKSNESAETGPQRRIECRDKKESTTTRENTAVQQMRKDHDHDDDHHTDDDDELAPGLIFCSTRDMKR